MQFPHELFASLDVFCHTRIILSVIRLAFMTMILIFTVVIVVCVLQFVDVLGLVDSSFMLTPEAELSIASDHRLSGSVESIGDEDISVKVGLRTDALVDALISALVRSVSSTEGLVLARG